MADESQLLSVIEKYPDKSYRIGDVSELLGIKVHVLRYWENEFKSFIRIEKTEGGQRLYSYKGIRTIFSIKKLLYSEGYSIAGAKKKLKDLRLKDREENLALVSRDVLVVIKEELEDICNSINNMLENLKL